MSLVKNTKLALDDARTLMLGAQILLGFQLQAPFQNMFAPATELENALNLTLLILMVVVVGLLIAPSAHHRLAYHGRASPELNRFINSISALTLLPFGIAFGLSLGLAAGRIGGTVAGILAGAIGAIFALTFWYGPALMRRKPANDEKEAMMSDTPLSAKIEFVLTETRVVLPGVQALLGFQLAIVLTSSFSEMPVIVKATHGVALGLIALATVLLLAPAVYHRLVYRGEDDPGFPPIANRLLLAGTLFLGAGLACDTFVVVLKISDSWRLAGALSALVACVLASLWFVWPMIARETK